MCERPSCPQILQLRSDNVIYFANAEYTIEHIIERLDEVTTPIKFLLLDFFAVGFIDTTGIDELRVLKDELKRRNIQLSLMGVHIPVKQIMESTGFLDELNTDFLIEVRGEANSYLFRRLAHAYCKNQCPYELFHECPSIN